MPNGTQFLAGGVEERHLNVRSLVQSALVQSSPECKRSVLDILRDLKYLHQSFLCASWDERIVIDRIRDLIPSQDLLLGSGIRPIRFE